MENRKKKGYDNDGTDKGQGSYDAMTITFSLGLLYILYCVYYVFFG